MRPLTDAQLRDIEKIVKEHTGVLLGVFSGEGNVPREWAQRLGLDPKDPSFLEQAFVLGKFTQTMTDAERDQLTYDTLLEAIKDNRLTTSEREAYSYAQRQAARNVTNAENKITAFIEDTNNRIGQKTMVEKEAIKQTVSNAVLKRQTRGQLASELGHVTADWTRDWERVANTELWDARLASTTQQILNGDTIYSSLKGTEARVFRRPSPDACRNCKRLYLESDGITPKIFKLHELVANGDNVGVKVADWKPTTHPTHPNCFVNGKTKILTAEGYKEIRHIEVGEYVLTHKGRFRAVTHTLAEYKKRYAGDIYKIGYKNNHGKTRTLDVTPEHKLLTQRGWVRADDLKQTDTLRILQDVCKGCGERFNVLNDNEHCKSCITKKQWSRRRDDPEELQAFRVKVSKTVTEHQKDPANRVKHNERTKRLARERMLRDNPMKRAEVVAKVRAANIARGTYEKSRKYMLAGGGITARKALKPESVATKPQVALYEKVKEIFPDAVLELPIETSAGKWYFIDVAIPAEKIAIEYDGGYWHDHPKRIESDRERDLNLAEDGWTTLRYRDEVPPEGKLQKDLERVMKNHEGVYAFSDYPIEGIEKTTVERKKLYDITVDEDHSFIAEGIVSHNCNCPMEAVPDGFTFDETGDLVPE